MTTEREMLDNIKNSKLCGYCCFYSKKGLCEHILSNDNCADRDSEDSCNINQFKFNDKFFSFTEGDK